MIGSVLSALAQDLAEFINKKSKSKSPKKNVVLHKPVLENGKLSLPDNAVSISLLNIEEDLSNRSAIVPKKVIDGKVYKQNPAVNIHLQILFLANFPKDYETELNVTTNIIEYFQQKSSLSAGNTKGLKDLGVGELSVKLNTVPMVQEDGAFWELLNAKYQAPLIYKVSMLVIQDDEQLTPIKLVKKVDIDSNIKDI